MSNSFIKMNYKSPPSVPACPPEKGDRASDETANLAKKKIASIQQSFCRRGEKKAVHSFSNWPISMEIRREDDALHFSFSPWFPCQWRNIKWGFCCLMCCNALPDTDVMGKADVMKIVFPFFPFPPFAMCWVNKSSNAFVSLAAWWTSSKRVRGLFSL